MIETIITGTVGAEAVPLSNQTFIGMLLGIIKSKEKEKTMKTQKSKGKPDILATSRIAAIVLGLGAIVLLVFYFVSTQSFGTAESLPVLIPAACTGLTMIIIGICIRRVTKKNKQ